MGTGGLTRSFLAEALTARPIPTPSRNFDAVFPAGFLPLGDDDVYMFIPGISGQPDAHEVPLLRQALFEP